MILFGSPFVTTNEYLSVDSIHPHPEEIGGMIRISLFNKNEFNEQNSVSDK